MTSSLRGMEEMTKGIPLGVKAREEGPTSSQGPASVGHRTQSGSLDCQHVPTAQGCPAVGPGGRNPKDSARTRLHGGAMLGRVMQLQTEYAPRTACLLAGGKEWALTPQAPVEASAPGLAREALRALSFEGELHHGLPRPRRPDTATPGLSRGQLGSSD